MPFLSHHLPAQESATLTVSSKLLAYNSRSSINWHFCTSLILSFSTTDWLSPLVKSSQLSILPCCLFACLWVFHQLECPPFLFPQPKHIISICSQLTYFRKIFLIKNFHQSLCWLIQNYQIKLWFRWIKIIKGTSDVIKFGMVCNSSCWLVKKIITVRKY